MTVTSTVSEKPPAVAVIVALPTLIAVTLPVESTVTYSESLVDHSTLSVQSFGLLVAERIVELPWFNVIDEFPLIVTLVAGTRTVIVMVVLTFPAVAVITAIAGLYLILKPYLSMKKEVVYDNIA